MRRLYGQRNGDPREKCAFHCMARGTERQRIFLDEEDYQVYWALLDEACQASGVEVWSACPMPNHDHELAHGTESQLSLFMHVLQGGYARHYNEKYEHIGHVWESSYKAFTKPAPVQIAQTSLYIHLNGLRIATGPEAYAMKYCTLDAFLGRKPRPNWLNPDPVLKLFGRTPEEGLDAYLKHLKAGIPRLEWVLNESERLFPTFATKERGPGRDPNRLSSLVYLLGVLREQAKFLSNDGHPGLPYDLAIVDVLRVSEQLSIRELGILLRWPEARVRQSLRELERVSNAPEFLKARAMLLENPFVLLNK